jgi:uncharacterized coiled-coil protein SlyX
MNRLIPLKGATPLFFIALALLYFAILPKAQAVVPPPDGGYPNFTTAEGHNALFNLTTGAANTAVGWFSLFSNTDGSYNTGVGAGALLFNVGDQSTGEGVENTALGAAALLFNTTGTQNTAAGAVALLNNTEGFANTASGFQALSSNTEGNNNTATGVLALFNNTTGAANTANGGLALFANTTGTSNTALGYFAGADITGVGNVCIGEGVVGEAGVDDSTYIRNVNTLTQNFSAGVNDYVTVRLSDGRLGHTAVVSSQRYKQDIKPLAAMSKALYALKPVSFRFKKEFDPTQALGFGLMAEEVEQVDPALVYRNDKGQVESVRYEMVNAMLLNEFLKEHRTIEQLKSDAARQETTITELKKDIGVLRTQLKEQAAQIQRVQAHIETGQPATRVAVKPPRRWWAVRDE